MILEKSGLVDLHGERLNLGEHRIKGEGALEITDIPV
jgi:hypothetical protein